MTHSLQPTLKDGLTITGNIHLRISRGNEAGNRCGERNHFGVYRQEYNQTLLLPGQQTEWKNE